MRTGISNTSKNENFEGLILKENEPLVIILIHEYYVNPNELQVVYLVKLSNLLYLNISTYNKTRDLIFLLRNDRIHPFHRQENM